MTAKLRVTCRFSELKAGVFVLRDMHWFYLRIDENN